MPISFLSPSRCVLLIGDEALQIYVVSGRATKLIERVPWTTADFENVVSEFIKNDCQGKPVLVVNDMTDQHFRGGQKMPKVGMTDKAKIVKRRLHVAFPNYPIRAALPLKTNKSGIEALIGGADSYLFSAIPMSEPILLTFKAIRNSMASIVGFVLLPIESASMVEALATALSKDDEKRSRWSVFMGQHKSGALRQVIVRDGQLAMTRMTPVSMDLSSPEIWAKDVAQEFQATVSYLMRFGFNPEDSAKVMVITSHDAGAALKSKIDIPCDYHTLTAGEAARILNMNIGVQSEQRFAETLHVAWAGQKNRFTMLMDAPELSKIHHPRQLATLAIFLLLGCFAYQGWEMVSKTQDLLLARDDVATQKEQKNRAEKERQREEQRVADLGFDVALINTALGSFENFERRRIKALPLIENIGKALGPDLRLDSLVVKYVDDEEKKRKSLRRGSVARADDNMEIEAHIKLSFESTIDLEEGYGRVRDLERRLSEYLPKFKVVVERQVAARTFDKGATGTVGDSPGRSSGQDYVAEIKIRGPVQ